MRYGALRVVLPHPGAFSDCSGPQAANSLETALEGARSVRRNVAGNIELVDVVPDDDALNTPVDKDGRCVRTSELGWFAVWVRGEIIGEGRAHWNRSRRGGGAAAVLQ